MDLASELTEKARNDPEFARAMQALDKLQAPPVWSETLLLGCNVDIDLQPDRSGQPMIVLNIVTPVGELIHVPIGQQVWNLLRTRAESLLDKARAAA